MLLVKKLPDNAGDLKDPVLIPGVGDPWGRAAPGEAAGFLSLPEPTVQGCSR